MINAPIIKLILAKVLFSLLIIGYKTINKVPSPSGNKANIIDASLDKYNIIDTSSLDKYKAILPFFRMKLSDNNTYYQNCVLYYRNNHDYCLN